MRHTLLSLILVLGMATGHAQDYDRLNDFMSKFSSTWAEKRLGRDTPKQIGTRCPDYYFTKKLNSKSLRGKFVLVNFWATWCSGCRLLSVDLDTLMMRNTQDYRDVQLIGCDSHEYLADKGFDADEWWKSKGILFPTVKGKGADEFCDTVHGGHPCMMLIDDKGIIRGRWDAWTPSAASEATLAVWALHVMPRDGVKADSVTIEKYLADGRPMEAAYLASILSDDVANAPLKFKTYMQISGNEALAFFNELRKKYEATMPQDPWASWDNIDAGYALAVKTIAMFVYNTQKVGTDVLKSVSEALNNTFQSRGRVDGHYRVIAAALRYRYTEAIYSGARKHIATLGSAQGKNWGLSASDVAEVQQMMAQYGIEPVHEDDPTKQGRMFEIDTETKQHMEGLTKKVDFQTSASSHVHATAELPQKMRPGATHYISVEVNIDNGWHAYPDIEATVKQGYIPTTIEVVLPKGFTKEGKVRIYPDGRDTLDGHSFLSQYFNVPSAKKLKGQKTFPVTIRLKYQVCDNGSCLPPVEVEINDELKLINNL